MVYRISTRISLRWLPDPPSEPTDTLVFNVGSHFMDLRVLKADHSIDWAMAGELKCRWIKTIDSMGPSEPDEGVFSRLSNGDDLETGSMPCPHRSNAMTAYEEVWRELAPSAGPARAWILQSADRGPQGRTTFLGRIGGGFMAFVEGTDGEVAVRREEWELDHGKEEGGMWRSVYAIGRAEGVPSLASTGSGQFEGEEGWRAGERVVVLGREYLVRAFEDFSRKQ